MTTLLARQIEALATALHVPLVDVNAFLAIALVSLICGLVSPLVVGARMAFFSDAMAHTGFAGAAVGVLILVVLTHPGSRLDESPDFWVVPLTMVVFAAAFGLAIGYVRESTGLSTDTVIGVFFALATGFGAMLIPGLNKRTRFDPEALLFGSPMYARPEDLLFLMALLAATLVFLQFRFNALVLASFNPTLARSRGVSVALGNYLLIVLLAMVVNFSIRAVGMLIINAMLVVPAAAAVNLSRNVRHMVAWSVAGSVGCGVVGYRICWSYQLTLFGETISLYPGGTIAPSTLAPRQRWPRSVCTL